MAEDLSCLHVQSLAYDVVRMALPDNIQKPLDQHLKTCETCQPHFKHFKELIEHFKILDLPPLVISSTPDSLRTRWIRLPWYLRSAAELLSIAALILLVVVFFPKIQTVYEKRVDTKLQEFKSGELEGTDHSKETSGGPKTDFDEEYLTDASGAPKESETLTTAKTRPALGVVGVASDKNSKKSEEPESAVKVGEHEIWRFTIRTDSPKDMRPKIVAILEKIIQGSEKKDALEGLQVPGGIQFNFLASKDYVASIKEALQAMVNAPVQSKEVEAVASKNYFTWYKKKSNQRDIPNGQSRIVIWLSQI